MFTAAYHEVVVSKLHIGGPSRPSYRSADRAAKLVLLSAGTPGFGVETAGGSACRAFHLLDVENFAGTPLPTPRQLVEAVLRYKAAVRFLPWDLGCLAVNGLAYSRLTDVLADPNLGFRPLKGERGRNGSDRVLIREAREQLQVATVDHLVIGSGDGAFADVARRWRKAGGHVTVCGRRATVSEALRRAADVTIEVSGRWHPMAA